ncbi:MAG: hypothetical protein A2077_02335 [Nitrospirae bacterium GWC2_46_6]|nr:MAG: hypothetical protein A2Z82_11145 [Nitrospirae bacterium GWA2_46_11]OGW22837.1 MAG: hypothetical protein A2077_02335 [Nitrospirae bacterium GWC2_46_6]OGW22887.1 MAG: hypothetical protein A2X55_10015 [Nitrospirae bacterium GWB2_47_37]
MRELENQFHSAMRDIYVNALRECRYKATRFLQMVESHGGVEAAKILLHTPGFQYGFTELWQCGCLRLTMEALVLQSKYVVLFTDEEREIARSRLQECGFDVDK